MALLFEGLVTRLEGSTGVGAKAGDRIYPLSGPENPTYPYITYQRIGANRHQNHQGKSGTQEARMQVDTWARTYTGARDTADEIRKSLDAYSGSTGGIAVQVALLVRDEDLLEGESADDRIYRVSQDYIFWADEST